MTKRIFGVILAAVMIAVVFCGCGEQISINGSSEVKYKVEENEVTVREFPDSSTSVSVTIPDEYEGKPVTKIADFAATNLESLESVIIGKNVREIGLWAFENNQKLKEFKVSPDNPYFCDVDGVLYTKDMKTLLFYPLSRGVETLTETDENGKQNEVTKIDYEIPQGVEVIRTKAFYKCSNLSSLIIPDTVKVIEEKAFFRCGSLKNVTLPESLTHIGKDAFGYCTGMTEIVIPSSVTQIDEYAFYNCTALKKVDVKRAEKDIKLGEKWFPTNNGRNLDGLNISWDK